MTDTNHSPEALHHEPENLRDVRNTFSDFLHILCNYDVKTPLTSIRGFVELMLCSHPLSDEQQTYLRIIQHNVQDITDVLANAISLAYFEKHSDELRNRLQIQPVDLVPIFDRHIISAREHINFMNEVLQRSRATAKGNPHCIIGHDIIATDLVINIPDALPLIQADERMIEQTIDILSRIVVKQHLIREVFFKVSLSPTHLTACIGWTGIVREDYLQTMFDQFATAHTGFAFTDHALGLYLCWKMVQLQGGELRLTINDQFKHQITFTLPYNAAQQGVAADAA